MLRHGLQYKSIWEILLSNLSLNVFMDSHSSITSAVQNLGLEVFRGRNKMCSSSADVQDSLEHVIVFCKLWNCFLAVKSRDPFLSLGSINILISTFCVLTKAIFILFTPTFLAYLQKKAPHSYYYYIILHLNTSANKDYFNKTVSFPHLVCIYSLL